MAVNIQRARDHGLPDYNTVRMHFGLDPVTRWEDINPTLYAQDSSVSNKYREIGLLGRIGTGDGALNWGIFYHPRKNLGGTLRVL